MSREKKKEIQVLQTVADVSEAEHSMSMNEWFQNF